MRETPKTFQWWPAGDVRVNEFFSNLSPDIGPAWADLLQSQVISLLREGHTPFIEFRHEALGIPFRDLPPEYVAGRIIGFFWRQPSSLGNIGAGVRAIVEWTEAGLEALHVKGMRYFSPVFCGGEPEPKPGDRLKIESISILENVGGLCFEHDKRGLGALDPVIEELSSREAEERKFPFLPRLLR